MLPRSLGVLAGQPVYRFTDQIRVPDVAAARSELEARGVEFLGETVDTGVCHMAFLRDSEGNVLILHRRYAARTKQP